MNETLKTIHHRRSIRSYKPEQIRDEELKIILDAGCMAPSAMDQQSWHFTVLQNPEILSRLVETAKKALGRDDSFSPLYGAPAMILVFGKRDAISPVSDGSLAIQNMFLAADSIGIGTCWINFVVHFFETPEGRAMLKEFGVDESYLSVGSFVLGYPAQSPQPKPRKEGRITIIR